MPIVLKALGVSPGVALAPALVLTRRENSDPSRKSGDPSVEKPALEMALDLTKGELHVLRDRTSESLGSASAEIFEAHLSMITDPELWASTEGFLAEGWDAATSFYRACQIFIDLLSGLEEEGQRSRADDLKDLRRRLLGHLNGSGKAADQGSQSGGSDCILVADDLTPSETVGLDLRSVKGILTASGSRTSHASILARSLGLPAATGAAAVLNVVRGGQWVALNGATGEVIVDPDQEQCERFRKTRAKEDRLRGEKQKFSTLPTRTRDGWSLDLAANIGRAEDISSVLENGAEGVGLFRTEFLFLDRPRTPTEDEQTAVYRCVLERMKGRPVVIRTLDIGGDKQIPYLPLAPEMNPFLGVRAVRLCLERPELFRTQIRSLLRASPAGDLRVMIPMVALVEEVRAVRVLFAEEKKRLQSEGTPVSSFQLGIMVEIPAAALNAEALAQEADFFSLGTNDLIQYTLAADRMNDRLTHLYQPLHPSLLRLIDMTVKGAKTRERWVGVCGEMAGDPEAAVVLTGLGVDELSVSATLIPGLRSVLSRVDRSKAVETARLAMTLGTSAEVQDLVKFRHPEIKEQEGESS